jgi:uncharacterized protein
MSESAPSREPVSAAEAVKAYIRMNRSQLAADGELLALLLPGRFDRSNIADLQQHALERLRAENQILRSERDLLKSTRDSGVLLSEGVRRAVLDLLDARSLAGVLAVASGAAPAFGADRAALCIESEALAASENLRPIAPGTVTAVVGPGGMGAILSGGGELLFGRTGYRSLAAFRLRLDRSTDALYVLGSLAEGRFEGRDSEAELGWFAHALERAIRAWLDQPRP